MIRLIALTKPPYASAHIAAPGEVTIGKDMCRYTIHIYIYIYFDKEDRRQTEARYQIACALFSRILKGIASFE
jgi:hypothetical protein